MKTKTINQLSINITNQCNMHCAHCLRGNARDERFDVSLLNRVFDGIEQIDTLTITGGEPSCYKEGVMAIANYIVENNVNVGGLFIVTNGKVYCQELVDAVKMVMHHNFKTYYFEDYVVGLDTAKDIRSYYEEEFTRCGVAVSIDQYHEAPPAINYYKYVTSGVYSSVKENDFKYGTLARGNAEGLVNSKWREVLELCIEEDGDDCLTVDQAYIAADGRVYGDCDLSYEMEEYCESAGDITEESLSDIIERFYREEVEQEEE